MPEPDAFGFHELPKIIGEGYRLFNCAVLHGVTSITGITTRQKIFPFNLPPVAKVLPITQIMNDKEKTGTTKKSVSMPNDLWEFVEEEAGNTGVPSRVIQQALREMRESRQERAKRQIADAAAKIKKAGSKKAKTRDE